MTVPQTRKTTRRLWIVAFVFAFAFHAALAFEWVKAPSGAVDAGDGGIDIALAAGGIENPETDVTGEISAETDLVEEDVVEETPEEVPPPEPEPEPEPAPQPEPKQQPKPEPRKDAAKPKPAKKTVAATPKPPQPVGGATIAGVAAPKKSLGGGKRLGKADYFAAVKAWLERHKDYPHFARAHRQQGVVELYCVIDRSGEVIISRIEKSSGYQLLDQATLDLIRRASPLPAPPPKVKGSRIAFIVPIDYSLK